MNQQSTFVPADEISLKSVMAECWRSAGRDKGKALDAFRVRVEKDAAVHAVMMAQAVSQIAPALLNTIIHAERDASWTGKVQPGGAANDRAHRVSQAWLMDFPLPSGKRLRDATREEVLEAANIYHAQAKDMAIKDRFLRGIAKEMKPRQIVVKALTEARLQQIKAEAEAHV